MQVGPSDLNQQVSSVIESSRFNGVIKTVTLLIVLLFLFSVFYGLDADPIQIRALGNPVDEGAWSHSARARILFGSNFLSPSDIGYCVFGAPFYSLILGLFYKCFGLSLVNCRLFSVLCFVGLVFGLVFYAWRTTGLFLSSLVLFVVLASNHTLFSFARYGNPLFLEICFSTLGFLLLVPTRFEDSMQGQMIDRPARFFIIGIIFALAVLSRLTNIFLHFGFLLVVVLRMWTFRVRREFFLWLVLGYSLGLLPYSIFALNNLEAFKNFIIGLVFGGKQSIALVSESFLRSYFVMLTGRLDQINLLPLYIAAVLWVIMGALCVAQAAVNRRLSVINLRRAVARRFLEISCLIWYFAGGAVLACFPDRDYERRFVILIVPLSLLFFRLTSFVHSYPNSMEKHNQGLSRNGNTRVAGWRVLKRCIVGGGVLNLVLLFIQVNSSLILSDLSGLTYTQREASRELGKITKRGDVTVGLASWLFSLENQSTDVFYNQDPKYARFNSDWLNLLGSSLTMDDLRIPKKGWVYLFESYPVDFKYDNSGLIRNGIPLSCFGGVEPSQCTFMQFDQKVVGSYWLFPDPITFYPRIFVQVTRISIREPSILGQNKIEFENYSVINNCRKDNFYL